LGSTDNSGVVERGFRSCGELAKGTLDGRSPACQELIKRWVRRSQGSFGRQGRALRSRKSFSAGIGQEAVGAPRKMHEVKTR
jgi:hypothetical protein